MNAPIDTLAFVQRFEDAGFGSEQARALAVAIGAANDAGRDDLVTKDHLDARLAEFRTEIVRELAAYRTEMIQALAAQNLSLTKAIAENGKDISGRLWSTVTIIAGVSTAISATIGAGVTLLLKAGGL